MGLVAYGVVHHETGAGRPPHCSVVDALSSGTGGDGDGDGSDGPYVLQPQQAANAATISAVGEARGLDEWAVTIAIATAMQESSLRNIDYGDRDSLGLFQQRPSMGWGSEAEIMDPVYSAGRFYDHLVEVPGYADLPLTVAAQTVQRSAFPDEYAKHEPRAAMLAGAFTGRDSATLSCAFTEDPEAAPGEAGELVRRLEREFGERGAAPTALRPTVEISGTGGSEVVEVVVPVPREAGEATTRTARRVAHWAVAHARELGVTRVTDGERRWEAATSTRGWRAEGTGGPGPGTEVRITLRR
ncbi:hypothetical protein LZF96_25675 [Streptomyces sp. ST2-7A]|nr:hypothetical protein [Streptomyces sp. ST2-7A]